jgi:alpha-amylase
LDNHDSKNHSDPLICYEIFVRSFCDSNKDGIGDINGITQKLDYFKDLGIDCLWLSPVCKSPSYHKYDILDYRKIDPDYGTLEDFKNLILNAHKRKIKIIFDLVINHTSSKHFWFEEAKNNKYSKFREYYHWKSPKEIEKLGIANREKTGDSMETQPWHWAKPNDEEKYYGMFWSEMPDLNMDSYELRIEIYDIGRYWLELGVDGFRLDAAKHIYPEWEIEKCYDFWIEFRKKMEEVNPEVYLIGEIWTSPEKIAPFFKGLKANFNFELSEEIQKLVKTSQNPNDIIANLLKSYKLYSKYNPDFIDATFLSNHDQIRIGSIAQGNIDKIKMAANLLLTLPGNPYLYYGEELGMLGKKPDEKIREAFLWDYRYEDKFRTNWQKPRYNTDSKVSPLAVQINDSNSVYNHYKKLISIRKAHKGLCSVSPPNLRKTDIEIEGIIGFVRPHIDGNLTIFQNISESKIEFNFNTNHQKLIYKSDSSKIGIDTIELSKYALLILLEDQK